MISLRRDESQVGEATNLALYFFLYQKGVDMPAKSQRQRRWAYGVKGKAWARRHHFNNRGKLPMTSRKKKK